MYAIGLEMAMARLRKLHIYCTSPARINPAGQLDVVCFDKTGTLTTDRIDVVGCASPHLPTPPDPTVGGLSEDGRGDGYGQKYGAVGVVVSVSEVGWHMYLCLALCHSLVPTPVSARGGGGKGASGGEGGQYIGDPLEIATFAATEASLEVCVCVCRCRSFFGGVC